MTTRTVSLTVNGRAVQADVDDRTLLVHLLGELGIDVRVGCDTSNCGACLVTIDGEVVKSCTTFAVQCRGQVVETTSGLAGRLNDHPVLAWWADAPAHVDAPCRSGAVHIVLELLARERELTADDVRSAMEVLICWCGQCDSIVSVVAALARESEGTR